MANITKTDIDLGSFQIGSASYQDETVDFAGVATYAAGTIMARLTANGRLTPFVSGGAGGAGVPVAILPVTLSATATSTQPARVLVRGTVDKSRLIIQADGDASNVTAAVVDQLRDYGILATDVQQLGGYDN